MTESEDKSVRRILVALDSASYGLAAMETAARLAADVRAELEGLFVEDIDLLQLAQLPFAQEISFASAATRPMEVSAVESSLRAKADEVRRALERTCHQFSAEWSFRVTRGHITRATLDASSGVDLAIIGRRGGSLAHSRRRSERMRRQQPILLVYDASPAGERALQVAIQLAAARPQPIVMALAEGTTESPETLRQAYRRHGGGQGLTVTLDPQIAAGAADLLDLAQRHQADLLIVNRHHPLLEGRALEQLIDRLDCPVGLVQ